MFLSGCALWKSHNIADPDYRLQQLTKAKNAYQDNNLAKAQEILQPLVIYGDARAQYALGYLLYQENKKSEQGISLIEQAAHAQYEPAKEALAMIHHPASIPADVVEIVEITAEPDQAFVASPLPNENVDAPRTEKEESPLLSVNNLKPNIPVEALPKSRTPALPLSPPTPITAPIEALAVDGTTKKSAPSDYKYTIQLAALKDMESLYRFIQKHQLTDRAKDLLIYQREKRPSLLLMFGKYRLARHAREALMTLPESLQQSGPWVRHKPTDLVALPL